MLGGTAFAQCISENELLLNHIIDNIYKTANSILVSHPLYKYFEKYLGGILIIMEPDGTILGSEDSATFRLPQTIGYIHPLDRETYYNAAATKAESLLDNDYIRSFDAFSELAGAIKLNNGLIFSYSGFEFLELKDSDECDTYKDIFETINLYMALSSDFFRPEATADFKPCRFSFDDDEDNLQNVIREEILFSLTQDELIDILVKIRTSGLQYNFSVLNDIFITKVLLENGFINLCSVKNAISAANKGFSLILDNLA